MIKKTGKSSAVFMLVIFSLLLSLKCLAQEEQPSYPRDSIIAAAHQIILSTKYCGLVTIDESGQPQVRTMNPFPMNKEMIVWFATSRSSRKVKEIKNDPRVSVYFADHNNVRGYVNITGIAQVIDDKELLLKKKRDYWDNIPGWQENFVLIKIVPKTLDVINYKRGITGDPKSFRSPSINF